MEFLVANRHQITRLKPEVEHIVISVCEPDYPFARLPENKQRLGLLQLIFTDIDKVETARQIGQEAFLMTRKQARKILSFVKKYKGKVKLIVCQCDGGVSRSSGTAAALSKILNGDDSWVFNSFRYVPNMHVYRLLISEYYQ